MQNNASNLVPAPRRLRGALIVLIGLTAAGTLSGCVSPEWRALQQARLLWEANGVYGYSYDLRISCFCPPDVTTPVRIVVQGDQPVSVTYVEDIESKGDPPSVYFERYDTIDELFDIVEEGVVGGAATVEVTYDPAFGFPAAAYVDQSLQIADEEIGWTIENFVPFRSSP